MVRLALFSVGFLVYTAVAAISVSQNPARYITETKAHSSIAGVCTAGGATNRLAHFDQNSTL